MPALVFLDTNILLYAISSAPREIGKRDKARELLESYEVGTSLQVIQEFHVNATGKLKKTVETHEIAGLIDWLLRQPLVETDAALFRGAVLIQGRYQISYWDAAVVAAAQRLEAESLCSEDLQHGQKFGDVKIINPFV
jgi:predicted nucleic acid-binding protein